MRSIHPYYTLMCAIYLISLAFQPASFAWILKAAPVCILITYVLLKPRFPTQWFLVTALCFSGLGDVLLEWDYFTFGLAAFLLTQLCYGVLFSRYWRGLKQRAIWGICLSIYMIVMTITLWPNLGNLQWPVMAYLCIIALMGLLALQSDLPWQWAPLGALIFISSDTLIALDKFIHPLPLRSYLVMLTYYAAQWMLIEGFVSKRLRTNG